MAEITRDKRLNEARGDDSLKSEQHYLGIAVAKPRYNVVDEHANVLALDALARVAEIRQQRVTNVQFLLDVRR